MDVEQKPCGFQQVGVAPAVRIYDLYNPVLICATQVVKVLILHRPEEGGGFHSLLLCRDPDLRHKRLDVVNSSASSSVKLMSPLTGCPPHQRWLSFSRLLKVKVASNTGSYMEFPTIP